VTRTTLELDPTVHAELKRRAKVECKSMGQIASEDLARAFKAGAASRRPLAGWIARELGEPFVPLEDKDALQEFFDREAGLIP